MKECISQSPEETLAIAREFASKIKPGTVLALEGDLGSGKTTFVKGLALGLGLEDEAEVKSPTFAIMHIYPTRIPFYHFDLYRLESDEEIRNIGFEEFIEDPSSVTCVEWAGKASNFLPPGTHRIRFEVAGENTRRITFLA